MPIGQHWTADTAELTSRHECIYNFRYNYGMMEYFPDNNYGNETIHCCLDSMINLRELKPASTRKVLLKFQSCQHPLIK